MFTLSSEAKKILSKLFILAIIFVVVNVILFQYLSNYTVAYPPLKRKAIVLFSQTPTPKIIIGGDSIAESGIDPRLLSQSDGINIAAPASGIQGFYKALSQYQLSTLSKDNILIINISVLNSNDDIIKNEHFIGQIDGFLNAGVPFLALSWKKNFFKNLFNTYQCTFSSCPYISSSPYIGIEKSNHHGFIPLAIPEGQAQKRADERKAMFANFNEYYKELNLNGVLFKEYAKSLKLLTETGAKIFIVYLPYAHDLQTQIDSYGPEKKLQNFIEHAKFECDHYKSNCYFLDYVNWDHSNLPGNDDENYYDYVHFTPNGAKRISTILKNDIELRLNGEKL